MLHPVSRSRILVLGALLLGACQGDDAYVGTWRAAGADSLDMRYQFFADGTARIVERGGDTPQVYEARYAVVGDSVLTLQWIDDLGPDGRFQIELDGDTLRLENPAGGQRTNWVRL
ncbi:hypothetical protein B1759_18305 [Rubrivirga sp. SAORIC476]|nr:hypothetical protein B1759_18305 [Rubrivirga sp. SAORIC476]